MISRRNLMASIGAGVASAAASRAMAQSFPFKPNQRYPDPAIEILDPSFAKYRIYSSTLEQVATGMRWVEGPIYFPEGNYLLFSDIPNNRIMKYSEKDGSLSVFRSPANFANGNTRDRQGRLVTCEHSVTRLITRTEKNGKLKAVITDLVNPNGLAFSPDERKLYVVEWKGTPNRRIWSYDVNPDGTVGNKTKLIDAADQGSLDGFRVDRDGNLWCGWGSNGALQSEPTDVNGRKVYQLKGRPEDLDGVMVFSPQGKPLAFIRLPERCENLTFGGPKNNRLYMAACHSIYALYVEAHGAT
ncbi:SMP-30/gluconolactonase/LRE family protein [Bradyrhizobium erythrophlei]|uniref:SMP-30/gluconolactonase/LRE family protein n=1 Tax=Bradyrhizobium erythrophlei TaxID=1437360 RepID=UPI0035EDFF17